MEAECYNELVDKGGCPSHPISLGRDILYHSGEYRKILSFWQNGLDQWTVFRYQLFEWNYFRSNQRFQRRSRHRFSSYCQKLPDHLSRQGFVHAFQLDENPDEQDKLTTWIECLGCESIKHKMHLCDVNRRQPQFNEAWKNLIDSGVLSPLDTAESLWAFPPGDSATYRG